MYSFICNNLKEGFLCVSLMIILLLESCLRMETELFAAVTAGEVDRTKELLKKETKETIDQVR